MNKRQFIQRIIDFFPTAFKNQDPLDVFDNYDKGISDNLDYDKLLTCFMQNYSSTSAPTPAYFRQFYAECYIAVDFLHMNAARRTALVKVANWYNSADSQWERRPTPDYIRSLMKQYQLSEREVDLMILSGELG